MDVVNLSIRVVIPLSEASPPLRFIVSVRQMSDDGRVYELWVAKNANGKESGVTKPQSAWLLNQKYASHVVMS